MDVVVLTVRLALALVFLVAAATKLMDRVGTARAVAGFGVPKSLATPVAILLPLAELVAAGLLVPGAVAWWGGLASLALLVAFSAAITINLARGNTPDCHCFGQIHSEPIGWPTLVRNGVLGIGALVVLAGGRTNRDPGAFHRLGQVSGAAWLGGAGAVVVIALVAAQLWFLLRLLRQNEQVLIRLKMVEADVRAGGAPVVAQDGSAQPVSDPLTDSERGLPPGSEAPFFELPDLTGARVDLEDLLLPGRPLYAVFTSADCGLCDRLLPEVARWEREQAGLVEIVTIATGNTEENRRKAARHGVRRMLLQKKREIEKDYLVDGSPAAVLVRPDGTVGSPVAAGINEIRGLFMRVLSLLPPEPLPAPTLELAPSLNRDGGELQGPPLASYFSPYIGIPAPAISVKDVRGEWFELDDLRGKRTVLLFSSTTCSWSRQLLPEIQAWEANSSPSAPQLVAVYTGTRSEVQDLRLQSPLLYDGPFELGNLYGATGTPIAALIEADGTYVSRVAGGDAILAVLREQIDWPAPGPVERSA